MSVLCKLVLRFEHPINCKVSPQDEVSSKGVLSIHVVSLGRLQAGKAGTGSSPCRILGGSYNVSVCVCVVSVIVKRPVLPPCVVDGRSRNSLYHYYYYLIWHHYACMYDFDSSNQEVCVL